MTVLVLVSAAIVLTVMLVRSYSGETAPPKRRARAAHAADAGNGSWMFVGGDGGASDCGAGDAGGSCGDGGGGGGGD